MARCSSELLEKGIRGEMDPHITCQFSLWQAGVHILNTYKIVTNQAYCGLPQHRNHRVWTPISLLLTELSSSGLSVPSGAVCEFCLAADCTVSNLCKIKDLKLRGLSNQSLSPAEIAQETRIVFSSIGHPSIFDKQFSQPVSSAHPSLNMQFLPRPSLLLVYIHLL